MQLKLSDLEIELLRKLDNGEAVSIYSDLLEAYDDDRFVPFDRRG